MNYLQSNNILQIILSTTVVGIISINVSKPINIDTALISIINVKIIEKKIFFSIAATVVTTQYIVINC